jgi:GT2 family glycosyltransferase
MPLRVSVIIPTYRRAETLARTLSGILGNDLAADEYEVIVVDDADDTATRLVVSAAARADGAPLTYVVNAGAGAAAARNAGARRARGEVFLFLDDDMQVAPDHLRAHLQTRAQHPEALIGGTRWYSPASLQALEATSFGRYRISLERSYAAGRAEGGHGDGVTVAPTMASYDLSVTRRIWEILGGFDESFPYAGSEDQDLCRRAAAAGFELIRNNAIRLLHDDPTARLREFGLREERGAHTVVALARKYPDLLGEFRRNDPIGRGDSPIVVAEKLAKEVLSLPSSLELLHRTFDLASSLRLPDSVLWPLCRVVVGLHTFLGYRQALGLGNRSNAPAPMQDGPSRSAGSAGAADSGATAPS